MGRRRPRPLTHALGQIQSDLSPPTLIARIQAQWPELVGAGIAEVTRPVTEREGVLTVHCANSVWAEELTLLKATLLEQLGDQIGAAAPRELRFRVGDLEIR